MSHHGREPAHPSLIELSLKLAECYARNGDRDTAQVRGGQEGAGRSVETLLPFGYVRECARYTGCVCRYTWLLAKVVFCS